jgi:hypothetical protein
MLRRRMEMVNDDVDVHVDVDVNVEVGENHEEVE